jgi:diguanylate cyclase (GGDEF)-like protein
MQIYLNVRKRRFISWLFLLLVSGFLATSLVSYYVSKASITSSLIRTELPLTSDNILTEIQKELITPIFISSMMANNTFLRDWVIKGEKTPDEMVQYLNEIQKRYQVFTSFFVSDKTRVYYQTRGILKQVDIKNTRDSWYFRVRNMKPNYEINVDPDMANNDAWTIFINYRVFDYKKNFIGATGVGLTVNAVKQMVEKCQKTYQREIYFVKKDGNIVLFANNANMSGKSIHNIEGLGKQSETILKQDSGSYQYVRDGNKFLLNVRYIPELNWYLFVEKNENDALSTIRKVLYLNILICLLISSVVMFITVITINRYQKRLEDMATTDSLTGVYNRQSFEILVDQIIKESKRMKSIVSAMMIDIDYFKIINDTYGHACGDKVLKELVDIIHKNLRESDVICRWGGEEFLVILNNCSIDDAIEVSEKVRIAVENELFCGEKQITATISIGVTEYHDKLIIDEMINNADIALYNAKHAGRNIVSK